MRWSAEALSLCVDVPHPMWVNGKQVLFRTWRWR
ncbi:hypothetical protein CLV56_0973 [Mumia flava]|uniref:Uncharacterized protein n=1 Tax=Mumia flava TaxID=1348852 RepID=A0A2M9BFP4_9ACTN|nr:hypothetical protein CLV56_0973 [Mumia flava]